MNNINLEDIQGTAKTLLDASGDLTGVPILSDDGTYPQTPLREEALGTEGIVVVIWQITGADNEDSIAARGRHSEVVEIMIAVEENRTINQSATGLNFSAEKGVRLILEALCGFPVETPFFAANPPWANLGTVDGVSQFIINLNIKTTI